MRGTIIHYNPIEGHGLIATQDGYQYPFAIGSWRSGTAPKVNQAVELQAVGSQATAVTLVPGRVLLMEKASHFLDRLGMRRRDPTPPDEPPPPL